MRGTDGPPLVSVVMPTWNYGRFLPEAVESVLRQGCLSMELLVIDDASTDDTSVIAMSLGDKIDYFKRQKNGGIAAARNTGIQRAKGNYLAFLDSDDAWLPEHLESGVTLMERQPAVDAVFGLVAQVNDSQFKEAVKDPSPWIPHAVPAWLASGMVFRRSSFDRVGEFDEQLSTGEFIKWVSMARSAGFRFEALDKLCLLRRIHANNTMRTAPKIAPNYGRLLKEHLDRQRKKSNE